MQRREWMGKSAALVLALPLAPRPAFAHHGWSSFDQNRPVYLEGRAAAVRWRNPHAELTLERSAIERVPADLASRSVPAQTAAIDGPALLRRAVLPTRRDARWEIELAPLFRMEAWRVPEIKNGDPLSVVGFMFAEEKGEPLLRVEYLFLGTQVYGLRSAPV